jgi:RNA polymerase sigma-70 factor (ECF subfamily)
MENGSRYDDKDLCRLIAAGDKDAFIELFKKYSAALSGFIFGLTKSDNITDENLQEIFMRVWYYREKFADLEDPKAYIFRVTAAVCYASLKQILTEDKIAYKVQHEFSYQGNQVAETARYYKLATDIQHAVKALTPPQKRVYQLSREKGLKIPEIAEELSLSPNNVRTILNDSVESIDDYLENKGHSFY